MGMHAFCMYYHKDILARYMTCNEIMEADMTVEMTSMHVGNDHAIDILMTGHMFDITMYSHMIKSLYKKLI